MTLSVTIKERTNLDLHNELIKKLKILYQFLKKDPNLQIQIEESQKRLFRI